VDSINLGSLREKEGYYNPIIQIEGINPFSGPVAGEAIAIPVRSLEILLISLVFVLVYYLLVVFLLFLIKNPKILVYLFVLSLLISFYLKTHKK
jgi:hypothetical protein